tara:strand:- start:152 stop:370 length:219 start_codon:yes stop_codon:yes gene_type:complete
LSKYFSNAKENKNNEKIAIRTDGIKVNREKNKIYFLFDKEPLILRFCFREFFVSKKIIEKKKIKSSMFVNNK